MNHSHHNECLCAHDLAICTKCDVVYCRKCSREWGSNYNYYFSRPYWQTTGYWSSLSGQMQQKDQGIQGAIPMQQSTSGCQHS